MNYSQGIYYWKWFIKAALREALAEGRDFCPVFLINPKGKA